MTEGVKVERRDGVQYLSSAHDLYLSLQTALSVTGKPFGRRRG
jgi:hypothetical protein